VPYNAYESHSFFVPKLRRAHMIMQRHNSKRQRQNADKHNRKRNQGLGGKRRRSALSQYLDQIP
jgi:hypothetical protein